MITPKLSLVAHCGPYRFTFDYRCLSPGTRHYIHDTNSCRISGSLPIRTPTTLTCVRVFPSTQVSYSTESEHINPLSLLLDESAIFPATCESRGFVSVIVLPEQSHCVTLTVLSSCNLERARVYRPNPARSEVPFGLGSRHMTIGVGEYMSEFRECPKPRHRQPVAFTFTNTMLFSRRDGFPGLPTT